MARRYRFGDILEWSSARWMVVRHTGRTVEGRAGDPNGYDAVWLGHDKGSAPNRAKAVGDISGISVNYKDRTKYLVDTDG